MQGKNDAFIIGKSWLLGTYSINIQKKSSAQADCINVAGLAPDHIVT